LDRKLVDRFFRDRFEGFTSSEIGVLLYFPFDEKKSPLLINSDIDENLINKVQFYNRTTQYLHLIEEQEPLKLTQRGNLPRKFCRELCDLGFLDDLRDSKFYKRHPLMSEEDSPCIHIINIITQLCGFTRKKHGKLFLTRKCKTYLYKKSASEIYKYIFISYAKKFNWAYDDYGSESWIMQAGFSIFLVQKYGDKLRKIKFYVDKFEHAFPSVMFDFHDTRHSNAEEEFRIYYYMRTFKDFLKRFGLIEIGNERDYYSGTQNIKKTVLLDQLIKWKKSGSFKYVFKSQNI